MTPFGILKDGQPVHSITLENGTLTARILTYGAILQDLRLAGIPYPLTLGFAEIAAYENDPAYFGALIAPVVNRIAGGQCDIDGKRWEFARNEGTTTLHSGPTGSHAAIWTVAGQTATSLTLTLDQAAGQGGFPGNRSLTATYALADSTLSLTIEATTDATTLMNPAHHGYWNLDGTPTWEGHVLRIMADRYLPTTDDNLPTGAIAPVDGTAWDMRAGVTLARAGAPKLDTNFCLADARGPLRDAVRLTGTSGVTLDIATTESGVQIFDAAPIDTGPAPTIHGHPYGARCGIAIEPQGWPDAPHNPAFPSIVLRPDTPYRQQTTFRFSRR
ncbi:aldose epimerase family protein [Oceaniglobus indicus]|uniref:aldose epimerase family protein n=1 Tax=Oceaniglobus indicus TaxID=2047749 RepID=UPI000C1A2B7B|nr:aldose epimerase family protein [Oceaniglobus indicus]